MTPLHEVFPPPHNFPEHPGSVGMQPCLHFITKRCHELFKVLGARSVNWILSDICGGKEGGGGQNDSRLHIWG